MTNDLLRIFIGCFHMLGGFALLLSIFAGKMIVQAIATLSPDGGFADEQRAERFDRKALSFFAVVMFFGGSL